MRFPDQAPVRPQKKQELQERIEKLGIDLDEVEATYVRASGPGGQKINKTSSAVVLRYAPLGIQYCLNTSSEIDVLFFNWLVATSR